jgi:hypothetical protein
MAKTKGRRGRQSWVAPEERMVGRNYTLRPRHVEWLEEQAQARAVTVSCVLRDMIDTAMVVEVATGTGKSEAAVIGEMAAAIAAEGLRRAEALVTEAFREYQGTTIKLNEALHQKFLKKLEAVKAELRRGEVVRDESLPAAEAHSSPDDSRPVAPTVAGA